MVNLIGLKVMPNLAPNNINKNHSEKQPAKKVSDRLQAIWWLTSVIKDGRSVNDLLAASNCEHSANTAFAKHILFGSLRYFHHIKATLDQLLDKPLKQKDADIFSILISGIYQLKYLSVPDHAAISESVDLAKNIKKKWASGLINAVLRGYQREYKTIDEKLQKADTYRFSHPNWIINQLKADWHEHYADILTANNERAPMTVRVNTGVISRADYQQQLRNHSIESKEHLIAKDALVLDEPCDVYALPGFTEGVVTLQDAAAQLVVEMLDLSANMKVLDGCSAPGGKTTHILQREPSTQLTSVEKSTLRLEKITKVLSRFNMDDNSFKVSLLNVDFLDYKDWWDGELFDRILIDVPCSASGVIRRNPDIKIHRKKTDMSSLIDIQSKILNAAWQILKPGGKLVYATCSIFKDENENQIGHFLKDLLLKGEEATLVDIPFKDNQTSGFGYQIFPGQLQMDGFYFCALQKPFD